MAEGVGFEPTVGGYPTTAFKAAALNRSATPPLWEAKSTLKSLFSHLPTLHHFPQFYHFLFPPLKIWCPEPDLNRHGCKLPEGF